MAFRAGVEIGALGLEIGAETAGNERDQRQTGLSHAAGDCLLARRDAARDDDATARGVEQGLLGKGFDFAGRGASRDLNKQLVGNVEQKMVADGVAGFGQPFENLREVGFCLTLSERAAEGVGDECAQGEAVRSLEEFGVSHDGPASFRISENVAGHALELPLREEDRVVKPRKPEGRRPFEQRGLGKGGVGLGAGDLEAADHLAEWRGKPPVNPDDAMEMLGHDGVLAGFDLGEYGGKPFPGGGYAVPQGRIDHRPVDNFAKNGAATADDQRDHVDPGLAVVPARKAYAGLEMAVLVALARVGKERLHDRHYTARGARMARPGGAGRVGRDPTARGA